MFIALYILLRIYRIDRKKGGADKWVPTKEIVPPSAATLRPLRLLPNIYFSGEEDIKDGS